MTIDYIGKHDFIYISGLYTNSPNIKNKDRINPIGMMTGY